MENKKLFLNKYGIWIGIGLIGTVAVILYNKKQKNKIINLKKQDNSNNNNNNNTEQKPNIELSETEQRTQDLLNQYIQKQKAWDKSVDFGSYYKENLKPIMLELNKLGKTIDKNLQLADITIEQNRKEPDWMRLQSKYNSIILKLNPPEKLNIPAVNEEERNKLIEAKQKLESIADSYNKFFYKAENTFGYIVKSK